MGTDVFSEHSIYKFGAGLFTPGQFLIQVILLGAFYLLATQLLFRMLEAIADLSQGKNL